MYSTATHLFYIAINPSRGYRNVYMCECNNFCKAEMSSTNFHVNNFLFKFWVYSLMMNMATLK